MGGGGPAAYPPAPFGAGVPQYPPQSGAPTPNYNYPPATGYPGGQPSFGGYPPNPNPSYNSTGYPPSQQPQPGYPTQTHSMYPSGPMGGASSCGPPMPMPGFGGGMGGMGGAPATSYPMPGTGPGSAYPPASGGYAQQPQAYPQQQQPHHHQQQTMAQVPQASYAPPTKSKVKLKCLWKRIHLKWCCLSPSVYLESTNLLHRQTQNSKTRNIRWRTMKIKLLFLSLYSSRALPLFVKRPTLMPTQTLKHCARR